MAKATTNYTLGGTWTKLCDAGQSLFLQVHRVSGQVYYAYKATSPNAGDVGHVLDPGETLIESAISTPLWDKAVGGDASVTASVGGSTTSAGTLATTSYNLTATWTQVASAGQNIHLDAISGQRVYWQYSSAAPTAGTIGHMLHPTEEYLDSSSDQNIWARSSSSDTNTATATLVVTAG